MGNESSFTRYTNNDQVSGMANYDAADAEFSNFPDISARSVEVLKSKGYKNLFPIQQHCF